MTFVRSLMLVGLALLASVGLVTAASAQAWPARPIHLIVPFGAGGATDVYARLIGQHLQAALGQPLVVENMPGGVFAIGTVAAAKAAPDGYTLVMVTSSHTLVEAMGVNLKKYQLMRDLVPVATLSSAESVLVVHPSLKANSVKELVVLAKSKPDQIYYGSSGIGSMLHLQAKLLESKTGIQMTHVPYKTGGGARLDLLEGRVQAMFDTITGAAPFIRSGKLRALGTTGAVRSPSLPDVPTLAEAGVPGYEVQVVIGLMAPAGTPQPIVERLNHEINTIMKRPDVREAWAKVDSQILVMSPQEYGKTLNAEIAKWTQIVKTSGITLVE